MPDQPRPPDHIMDLAAGPLGGPEEARLPPEQRAEVEEQRAVRRMLSSLPDPQLTPEEQRDLRRAVHAAAEESARAVPAPPARRRRWSRAWPALAAAASLAVVVAVALNLRDLGDTVTEQVAVTAAPQTTAASTRVETTAAPTTTAAARGTDMMASAPESAADLAAVDLVTEEMADASAPEDAPQTDEDASQANIAPQPASAPTEAAEREAMFSLTWAKTLPRFHEGADGYSEEELADRAREAAAGRPDAFPLPYANLEEYATETELACWNHFAAGTDDDRTTVLFAGRAWIGDYWYEVYYVETDYPAQGLRETIVAFTPPGGLPGTATENNAADTDACPPLTITEH